MLALRSPCGDLAHRSAGEFVNRSGNKRLKSDLFNSAFASLHREPSCRYYDMKRAENKPINKQPSPWLAAG